MCYGYVFAKVQGERIYGIHIEGMWGLDFEICHMFADSLAVLILRYLTHKAFKAAIIAIIAL